jgi:hypothetical protein
MKAGELDVTVSGVDESGEGRTAAASITVDALPAVPSGASTPPVVLLNGWQFSVFPPSIMVRITIARRGWMIRHLKWFVPKFMLFFTAAMIFCAVMTSVRVRGWWVFYVAVGISSPLMGRTPSLERSRKIPVRTRRAVIEGHEAVTGRPFDPTVEEIDHMLPFKKGGGHTKDNLWVVARKVNRAKGDATPMLEEWLRFTVYQFRRMRGRKPK